MLLTSLVACKKPIVKNERYSILVDTTDEHLSTVNAKELLQLFDLKNDAKSIHLRYSTITDVDFNEVSELSFTPEASGLLGNELKAKKKRIQFEREVEQLLTPLDTLVDAKYSSIFDPIIQELQYLGSQKSYDSKVLIVYSNLIENSEWISFYTSKDYYLLRYEQKLLINRFLERVPQFSHENLRLQIVYIPHNQKDNTNFKALQK